MPTTSLPAALSIHRHSLGRLISNSTVLLLFTIGTLIIVLALLILFDHNLNATKGYQLRSLEKGRSQLMVQQEILNMDIAISQALATLQDDPRVKSMVRISKPAFVHAEDSVAAALSR